MNKFTRFGPVLALLLFLNACGGAGDSEETSSIVFDSPGETESKSGYTLYTLSGQVRAGGALFDTDTATESAEANDSMEEAQRIGERARITGHLDRSTGDTSDVYGVQLAAGQSVKLLIADPDQADLDLFLTDADGDLLQASQGGHGVETVQAPATGLHYLTVTAEAGASDYLLRMVGDADGPPTIGLTQDFVPGEVIVRYRNEGLSALSAAETAPIPGLRRKGGTRGRGMLFEVLPSVSLQSADRGSHPLVDESRLETRRKMDTIRALKKLQRDPRVRFAEPNYRVRSLFVPNDTLYARYQWNYPLISLPQAWDLTLGTSDTVVAVVDSGVVFGHPDLDPNLLKGYDFVAGSQNGDGDGIDPDPTDLSDVGYHGTHVAGTVAAATDNSRGVAGVAGNVRILPLRALSGEEGTSYDIAQAIRYAAGLPNDSGTVPERPAAVINMSLGGVYSSSLQRDACIAARNAGSILVASAGNDGTADPMYPATYPEVLSVSAVNAQKELTWYSNHGATISLAAPGGEGSYRILSTSWDKTENSDDYVFMSGTSMAAPHVSGVIALMHSLAPSLTPEDVEDLLTSGALTDDLGPSGKDDSFGYGLINAYKAALEAQQLNLQTAPSISSSILIAEPASLSFSATATEASFSLRNSGGGEFQVASVSTPASWITVRPSSVDPDTGLGDYTVSVDRAKMLYGENTSEIFVESDGGDLQIPVTATKEISSEDMVYIVLTDSAGKTVAQSQGSLDGTGGLDFTLADLPAGDYRLFAGTDADEDMILCDPGEVCGSVPDPLTAEGFHLDSDREGLQISIGLPLPQTGLPSGIPLPKRLK